MGFTAEGTSHTFVCSGAVTSYPIPFQYLDAGIEAYRHTSTVFDPATATLQVLGSDYTLSGDGRAAAGALLPATPFTTGRLTVIRTTPLDMDASYSPNDAFPADSHQRQLERLSMVSEEAALTLQDVASRAPLVPPGETAPAFPKLADRTQYYLLGFGAAGALQVYPLTADKINTVANRDADIHTVAARDADIGVVAYNLSHTNTIGTVATYIGNVNAIGPYIGNVNTLAPYIGNVNTLAPRASDIAALAPRSADLIALAPHASDLGALGTHGADLGTLAPHVSDMGTLAPLAPSMAELAGDFDLGTGSILRRAQDGLAFYKANLNLALANAGPKLQRYSIGSQSTNRYISRGYPLPRLSIAQAGSTNPFASGPLLEMAGADLNAIFLGHSFFGLGPETAGKGLGLVAKTTRLLTALGHRVNAANCGIIGAGLNYVYPLAGGLPNLYDWADQVALPLYNPLLVNRLWFLGESNDWALGGRTGAQSVADLIALRALMLTHGWTGGKELVVVIDPPRGNNGPSSAFEIARQYYIGQVVALQATYGWQIVRIDLNASLGTLGQQHTDFYLADATHWASKGDDVAAPLLAAVDLTR